MIPERGSWDRLLEPLLRARRFEEVLVDNAALVTGVFHVSIGMESGAAALAQLRRREDSIMLGHRNHGYLAAIGSDLELLYRELLGRDGGPHRGRAGSVHLSDPSRGVPYTSAMLAGGAAVGAGLALAKHRRGEPGIVFTFFGDGAMGEGLIYETLNLVAVWRLPIVLVCENNAPPGAEGSLAALAAAHGVASDVVDGRDPRATLAALSAGVTRTRERSEPSFLEVGSESWPGNSTFLPHPLPPLDLAAIDASPPDAFAAGDPVRREAVALLADGISRAELVELDAEVTARAHAAMDAARAAPPAPPSAAFEHVWGPS